MKRTAISAVGLLGALWMAACAAEEFNPEELERKVIELPTGEKFTEVVYKDRNWREMDADILQASRRTGSSEICFEAKFDWARNGVVKLFGRKGRILSRDPAKLKYMQRLKRSENVWICGVLRPRPGTKSVELLLVDIRKTAGDLKRVENRLKRLLRQKDADGLISLGHRIKKLLDAKIFDFNKNDQFIGLRLRSFISGLALKEKALDPNDADALYALGVKWYELLRKTHKYHEFVRRALKVDPDHPQASRVAREEMGMLKFEGRWMTQEQKEKLLAERKTRQERMEAERRRRMALKAKQRKEAVRERQHLLMAYQTALRTERTKERERALDALGKAVRDTLDPVFGRLGIDILAGISDPAAVDPALNHATQNEYPEVRREALEALAWRGGDRAFLALAGALRREQDAETAHAGVNALVEQGGAPALQALIGSLKSPNKPVQLEVIEGLKTLTGQPYATREAWERWWRTRQARKDLKPSPPGRR